MGILDSKIIKEIKSSNDKLTNKIIVDLIKQHKSERERMLGLWQRYKGNTPIKHRSFRNPLKINEKLSHDFRGQIINQSVGYLYGNPITYDAIKENYTPETYNAIKNQITLLNNINSIEDLDSSTGEYASVCGYGSRLLYFDINGILRIMNIKPWESIFIYDSSIDEVQYGIVYYYMDDDTDGTDKKHLKVEFYDKNNVTYYYEIGDKNFILDPNEPNNPMSHGFNDVPMIKFSNNNLEKGDFENVETLIDTYDILISDVQNELEEFRLAYLAFIGGVITPEELVKAQQTGAFNLKDKDSDIKFITKQMDGTIIDSHKKTIRENIYQLSNTVDFNDVAFTGNAESGEARKLKYQGLESKCIKKQRKFIKGLQDQYKLISQIWSKININLNPMDMKYQFSRNLPIDLQYYATVVKILDGQVSDKTRYSLMPFITDPDIEIAQMESDQERKGNIINLDNFITTGSAA